jgi:metal-responsive CopG/Arc/MetJ family transcriptional regulator
MIYMTRLVIDISEDMAAELAKLSEQEGLSPEEAARDMIRRQLVVKKFRELAAEGEKYARAAGYTSEEEILAMPRMPHEDSP